MCACVFVVNIAILVNGLPTQEFRIQRGLKKGDSQSPFLCLFVAESHNRLLSRTIEFDFYLALVWARWILWSLIFSMRMKL